MSRLLSRGLAAALCGVLAALLTGCGGSKPVPVSGKIVPPPKVKFEDTDTISVVFKNEDGAGPNATATASAKDFTFSTNVTPGKYQLIVEAKAYPGSKDFDAHKGKLGQAFSTVSGGSSPLKVEITGDANQSITVDIAGGKVGKP